MCCSMYCFFVLFYVLFVCDVLYIVCVQICTTALGVKTIADKYVMSYHIQYCRENQIITFMLISLFPKIVQFVR